MKIFFSVSVLPFTLSLLKERSRQLSGEYCKFRFFGYSFFTVRFPLTVHFRITFTNKTFKSILVFREDSIWVTRFESVPNFRYCAGIYSNISAFLNRFTIEFQVVMRNFRYLQVVKNKPMNVSTYPILAVKTRLSVVPLLCPVEHYHKRYSWSMMVAKFASTENIVSQIHTNAWKRIVLMELNSKL